MIDVLRSGSALARAARRGAVRAGLRSAPRRARSLSAAPAAPPGLHLAIRAAGVRAGDEVITPVLVRGVGQLLCCTRAPARCSRASTRARSTSTRRPRPPRSTAGDSPAARTRLRLSGRHARARAARRQRGLWIVEDACEALGARHADGRAVGGARPPCGLRLLSQQAADDREGGMLTLATRGRSSERIDSERNQGRAPDMGWLDHDRLGFNYRLSDIACAIGVAQLDRLDACSPRARVAGCTASARGYRGPGAALRGRRRRRARVVRVRRAAPHGVDATRRSRRCGRGHPEQALSARDPTDELLPRALRPSGGVPVCEDVAARSLALPFFPEMTRARSRASARRCARRSGR